MVLLLSCTVARTLCIFWITCTTLKNLINVLLYRLMTLKVGFFNCDTIPYLKVLIFFFVIDIKMHCIYVAFFIVSKIIFSKMNKVARK